MLEASVPLVVTVGRLPTDCLAVAAVTPAAVREVAAVLVREQAEGGTPSHPPTQQVSVALACRHLLLGQQLPVAAEAAAALMRPSVVSAVAAVLGVAVAERT